MSKHMPPKRPNRLFSFIAFCGIMLTGLYTAKNVLQDEENRRRAEARTAALKDTEKHLAQMESDIKLIEIYDRAAKSGNLTTSQCRSLETLPAMMEMDKKMAESNRTLLEVFQYASPSELRAFQRRSDYAYNIVMKSASVLTEICKMGFNPPTIPKQEVITEIARPWYERAEIEFDPNK